MKFRNVILPLAAISVCAGTLRAESLPPSPAAGTPPPSQERREPGRIALGEDDVPPPPPPCGFSREEAKLMRSLFLLSDAQLHRLGDFIRRLEKMPRERRRQMAEDLERVSAETTPEKRAAYEKEMRERFRRAQENLLDRYFSTLSPEQADAEREKFLGLDRKARREYIMGVREKLGLPPLPPSSEKRPRERRQGTGAGAPRN